MKSNAVLPALILGLLLVPLVQGIDLPYPKTADAPITVDLKADAGKSLDWLLDVKESMKAAGCLEGLSKHTDASSSIATLQKRVANGESPTELTLGLVRNTIYTPRDNDPNTFDTNTVFKGSMSVDTLRLVEGTWDMSLTVADRFGVTHDCTDDRTLEVTADDDASPVVTFPGKDPTDGIIRLHAGQALQPKVTDDLIGVVEYRIDRTVNGQPAGMPADKFFTLKAPYLVDSKSFFPGENELTIRATDRAGNAPTVAKVTVLKDDSAPELSVSFPRGKTLYVGAFIPINFTVADQSDYTLVVRLQGEKSTVTGTGGVETDFQIGFSGVFVGQSQLVVTATDAFGNSAKFTSLVNVTRLTTSARILELEALQDRRIVGEDIELNVTMVQDDGLADVNFTLSVSGQELGEMQVPADDQNSTILVLKNILPGTHKFSVRAEAEPEIVILDAVNLTKEITLEVFLARIHVGEDVYHIRTDARGLPNAAVDEKDKAYPLKLVEKGTKSVYAWSIANATMEFDPAGERDQIFLADEAPTGTDGNEAPGAGIMLLLGALVGAAFVARRRV